MQHDRRKNQNSSPLGAAAPSMLLERLPEIEFDPAELRAKQDARRPDLLRSVLAVAEMNHLTEALLVREAVANALGRVPGVGE